MKLARGSYTWILIPCVLGILLLFIALVFATTSFFAIAVFFSFILLLLTMWFLVFFRDPERTVGKGIVAPADGAIRSITTTTENDQPYTCISTFMNIHNVHVNRMPLDGTVEEMTRVPGSHLPAFTKESEKNERVVITLDTSIGRVKVVQIAGTVARRIVPYIKKGDMLKKGQRIGIIRLGSRVDIYLPTKAIKHLTVRVADHIRAGEDTLAEINA
ncbi:MAG: phosphatidylserine decarboxylase [Candidatus Thermoplasmatota archaeon]|nr:phosphatidylserine decarboxylase [Candidatus Thermoplasmatota archaeon]